MTKPKDAPQPTYAERERDVLLALAMQVATDPNASPEDIAAARRRLATPDDPTQADLERVPLHLLAAWRELLADAIKLTEQMVSSSPADKLG